MKLPHAPSGDPLLTATTLLLYFVSAFLIIVGIALAVAVVAVPLGWGEITFEIAKEYPKATTADLMPALLGCVALALAVVVLAFQFVRKLLQLIQTVGEGDPFVTANATRLEHMAWITLVIQVIGLILGGLVLHISEALKEADKHYDIGFSGLLTILLLFILARVFRRGAEMRADLEGTV